VIGRTWREQQGRDQRPFANSGSWVLYGCIYPQQTWRAGALTGPGHPATRYCSNVRQMRGCGRSGRPRGHARGFDDSQASLGESLKPPSSGPNVFQWDEEG
jgi:hypothetical protein